MGNNPIVYFFRFLAIVLAFTVHELCHGVMAYRLGDTTAKYDGRLSLNPKNHIDMIGMLVLLLFGIGWAKPVRVNPEQFKNKKAGMALTALAGPLSNVLLAFVSLLILLPMTNYFYRLDSIAMPVQFIILFLEQSFYINISLSILNMLPFPPLDGSKVFAAVFSEKTYFDYIGTGNFGMIIFLILIWTGWLDKILGPPIYWMQQGMIGIAEMIFPFL